MNSEVILKTLKGKLRGNVSKDYNGNNFYSFQGIRYGKPPIAELRFQAPVVSDSWKGIQDATKEGNASLSMDDSGKISGSEDCLFLNVYSPKVANNGTIKLYPVMFWIHGGMFLTGSGGTDFFGPEYLIAENVVLVTVNYRLGIFGFLSVEEQSYKIPGNAGIKDLLLALQWVQTNIATFGGDPKNVTLNGSSAGAALVHYLILSPLAKDLFHHAIMQSGCALSPWALAKKANKKVIKILGCHSETEEDVLNFLYKTPAEELIAAQNNIIKFSYAYFQRYFGPVIEDNNKSAIITQHPLDIMKSGIYNKVPIIMGYNSQEGIIAELIYPGIVCHEFNNFSECVPYYLNIPNDDYILSTMGEKIKQYYYRKPESDKMEKANFFYTLLTDLLVIQGIYQSFQLFEKNLGHPIYFYRLSAETKLNVLKNIMGSKDKGTCHGDELGYLFKNIFNSPVEKNSIEELCMLRMTKLWGNFLRKGNPNESVLNTFIDVNWLPIKSDKYNCLDIGTKLSAVINLDIERMEIWNEIINLSPYASKYKQFS